MIFAIGYRVRTAKAIQFRKWVTSIVEKHLVTNYITSGALVNINDYLLNKFETHCKSISVRIYNEYFIFSGGNKY